MRGILISGIIDIMAIQLETNALIEDTLAAFFDSSISQARAIDEHYLTLWENLKTLHGAGGKRIRPKIVLLSYGAFGGKDLASIAPIACAHELLHFSMLIHDDIIDRDLTRYSVDNISGSYSKLYSPFVTSTNDRLHYANSAAIMAGDLMIAGAHKLINTSSVDSDMKTQAFDILYESIFSVAGGELLDTESSFRPFGAIDPLKITRYKTASYSFVAPIVTGAVLAGASAQHIETLTALATNLGIAYQLTDDLLGVFGDEALTGKSNTGDIREGKKTYLIAQTIANLNTAEIAFFTTYFGKADATTKDIDAIKELIVTSGAKQHIEQKIDDYVQQTYAALESLALAPAIATEFADLITKATKRDF